MACATWSAVTCATLVGLGVASGSRSRPQPARPMSSTMAPKVRQAGRRIFNPISCFQLGVLRVIQRLLAHGGRIALAVVIDLQWRAVLGVVQRQVAIADALAHAVAVVGAGDVAQRLLAAGLEDRLFAHD